MDNNQLSATIDFLAKVPFFSEVSRKSLSHLCEDLEAERFQVKETIFSKDERGEAMYVIVSGRVKVHDNAHVYGYLSEGECFGEYSLIDNETRSASITAEEKTEVLKIERSRFIELMTKDSGFAHGILAVMIKRHRDLDVTQEQLATSINELEQTHAKMSGLVNGAMDAIIMFDANFRIILTNPSANQLLENEDVAQRNVLFFLDEPSAQLIESLIQTGDSETMNEYLPSYVTVIGSNETETLNEGTISKYGTENEPFYTLILRNIEKRLQAEETISLLTRKTQYLSQEIKELTNRYGILGEDKSMLSVIQQMEQVANTTATVLITGETGTGKELVARAIHSASPRKDKPLISVNCGAIPANLIESELFGHEKGAFTGATERRKGRFLLADQGTLFLDEIGELPIDLQPKLLRVLQEGEFNPLGSNETIKVDVRIIAATHKDLLTHAIEGKFREDLYYRLNVFPLEVPALRNRGNDVCLIAQEMIRSFSAKLNKAPIELGEGDESMLLSYDWPGNVRELQNLIERAVIISNRGSVNWRQIIPMGSESTDVKSPTTSEKIYTSEEMVNLEKENILLALRKTGWKVSGKNGAASLLQMAPTTLASKIKSLGISRPV